MRVNNLYITDNLISVENQPTGLGSRSIVDQWNNSSETNPKLLSDWENVEYIKINNQNNIINEITPPWRYGTPSALPAGFGFDIKKEDGWTMLFHTFKSQSDNPGLNYMFFYNLFTGDVKVFYYYDGQATATNSQWFFKYNEKKPKDSTSFRMFYVPTFLSKAERNRMSQPPLKPKIGGLLKNS